MDIEANLMPADEFSAGKKALEIECALLKKLGDVTEEYSKQLEPGTLGHRIVIDWLGSFRELHVLSQRLATTSNSDFRKDLEEEIDALDVFIKAAKDNKLGISWKRLFRGDREIAERLLNK